MTAQAWRSFICRACGWIYDEALGDADGGLPPGTRFEDIPDDWACPLCGVSKADFEPHEPLPTLRSTATAATSTRRSGLGARHDAGVVIVGAGCAGWQMAQALREHDADLPITIVTDCKNTDGTAATGAASSTWPGQTDQDSGNWMTRFRGP